MNNAPNNLERSKLGEELSTLAQRGIQADKDRLLRDMCSQFTDPNEWIREYVVNAYDAGAKNCWISGRENEDEMTIMIRDDGRGMDLDRLKVFFTIFKSVKDTDAAIGTHGIGKLSVAAIPGQKHFAVETSDGNGAWRAELGCLLDNEPFAIQAMPLPEHRGTCFSVTYAKVFSLADELGELSRIINKYLKYLPIDVHIRYPGAAEERVVDIHSMPWFDPEDHLSRIYSYQYDGIQYQVVLSLGTGRHEIYQKYVLISDQYDLFAFSGKDSFKIPHLTVRVESEGFELPFGRHKLRNEKEALEPLAINLLYQIIPDYFDLLYRTYTTGAYSRLNIPPAVIEEIACALIFHDTRPDRKWCSMPQFVTKNRQRLSFNQLDELVKAKNILFIEAEDQTGIDYNVFDAPVIALDQSPGGLVVIKRMFGEFLVNLNTDDAVLEDPGSDSGRLSEQEMRFQNSLGIDPQLLRLEHTREGNKESVESDISFDDLIRSMGTVTESLSAHDEMGELQWKLSRLVLRDGVTPCLAHRFLYQQNTVILNRHHPDIQKLVALSEKYPGLASHWALAYCMTGEGRILKHLTPEMREDLLLMDAMTKCGQTPAANDENDTMPDAGYLFTLREMFGSQD